MLEIFEHCLLYVMYYFCEQSLSAKARNGGHPVFKCSDGRASGFFLARKILQIIGRLSER